MGRSNKDGAPLYGGLLAGSALYGVLGAIVLSFGIYLTVDKSSFVTLVVGTVMPYLSTVLVTLAGAVSVGVSFIGCFGSLARNRCLLATFLMLLIAIYVVALVGTASAIVFRSWISEQIRTYMRDVLQTQYGTNSTKAEQATTSWDTVQQKWYCCGVEDQSWGVFKQSEWYTLQPGIVEADKPLVPLSCCSIDQYGRYRNVQKCQLFLLGPPNKQTGENNEALYYNGCYAMGSKILYELAGHVIGMGLVLCFMDLILAGLSLWAILTGRTITA